MTVRMLVFLAVTAISVSLAASATNSITIKGKIMNMDEIEKLITSDSFLQLMPYPGKGTSLKGKTDTRGRLIFESHLAKVKLSKSGRFSISYSHPEAGRYAIAGQNLEPSPGQIQLGPLFLVGKGERRAFEIKVPEDINGPTLDIGEVFLPVANSKYFTKGE